VGDRLADPGLVTEAAMPLNGSIWVGIILSGSKGGTAWTRSLQLWSRRWLRS